MSEILTPEQRAKAVLLAQDFTYYAPRCLKIKSKNGQIVPFAMNRAQVYLHEKVEEQRRTTGRVRALCLKGRQQGCSTYWEGRFYWKTSTNRGKKAYILTHLQEATDNLFTMTRRYHENCPEVIKPSTRNESAKALTFDQLDSEFSVATAGSKDTGRGGTGQYFHGCLGLDTDVVRAGGSLAKVRDVCIGDLLVTHTGALAPVTWISQQEKDAFSVRLKGLTAFPLIATNEHRFWTQAGWKELADIQVGESIGYPVRRITGEIGTLPFKVPFAIRPQGGGRREIDCPDNVLLDEKLGLVVGLYLAEGSIARQSKAPHAPNSVTFTVHEREVARTVEWLSRVQQLFGKIRVYPHKESKTVAITVSGKSFATFLENLVGAKDDKRFPSQWWRMPTDFIESVVLGYLAGDGHCSKRDGDRRISLTSIRSATITGLRDALASLGAGWATVTYKPAGKRHDRNEREAWTLRLCGRGVDYIAEKLGWYMPTRKRFGNYGEVDVRDGYAWIPVKSVAPIGKTTVRDFEIGHEDHSYCVLHGASHNSEVAFWANAADHMAGIGQTIPNEPGTEIALESTGNGLGNLFHSMWVDATRGNSDYIPIFIPWFWQPEYSLIAPAGWMPESDGAEYMELYGISSGQAYWRERKIKTDFRGETTLFDQEYPATPELAFRRQALNTLLKIETIERAMKRTGIEPIGPRVMGIDPAESEFGDDTVFCIRQGRVVQEFRRFHGRTTTEVVALAARAIQDWQPDYINCDAGGLGSGIADRLIELGHPVTRVLFGERAIELDLYGLRRDEMWGEMAEWFKDETQLPYDMAVLTDLTSPGKDEDGSLRFKLETKKHMASRGLKSPDAGDALALTFAVPVVAATRNKRPNREMDVGRSWRTL